MIAHSCSRMKDAVERRDVPIYYGPRQREFAINYTVASQIQMIYYCPFCGDELPRSLSDEWFERLESMGIEHPWEDPERMPVDMRTDAWWRNDPGLA